MELDRLYRLEYEDMHILHSRSRASCELQSQGPVAPLTESKVNRLE